MAKATFAANSGKVFISIEGIENSAREFDPFSEFHGDPSNFEFPEEITAQFECQIEDELNALCAENGIELDDIENYDAVCKALTDFYCPGFIDTWLKANEEPYDYDAELLEMMEFMNDIVSNQ